MTLTNTGYPPPRGDTYFQNIHPRELRGGKERKKPRQKRGGNRKGVSNSETPLNMDYAEISSFCHVIATTVHKTVR
jgi:hypothetical protein